TDGGEPDAKAIARSGLETRLVDERGRDRLVGIPELRPGGVAALRVVRDIEHRRPGPPGDVKGLLGIEGQGGHRAPVVLRLDQLPVADGDIVLRLHRDILAALLHGSRLPAVEGTAEGGRAREPGDPPERAVEGARAVPRPRRLVERLAKCHLEWLIRDPKLTPSYRPQCR